MILSVHGGGGSVPAGGEGWVRSSCWGGGVGQPGGRGGSATGGRGGSGPAGGGGGSAKIEQHREYLLHGGRYASCVHAGGLSCYVNNLHLYNKVYIWMSRKSQKVLPFLAHEYISTGCFEHESNDLFSMQMQFIFSRSKKI